MTGYTGTKPTASVMCFKFIYSCSQWISYKQMKEQEGGGGGRGGVRGGGGRGTHPVHKLRHLCVSASTLMKFNML